MELSDKSKIWLKPPQWYEINKLLKMEGFSGYQEHSQRDIRRWMPVRIVTLDGEISLLPGMKPIIADAFTIPGHIYKPF